MSISCLLTNFNNLKILYSRLVHTLPQVEDIVNTVKKVLARNKK